MVLLVVLVVVAVLGLVHMLALVVQELLAKVIQEEMDFNNQLILLVVEVVEPIQQDLMVLLLQ